MLIKKEVGKVCSEERKIKDLMEYGIVNMNKPSGPSSHQTSDYVKKIFGLKKAGHSGTLDPKVTGVLPIALDKATRIVQVLLKSGKEYVCLMYLHKEVNEKEIRKTVKKFKGKIKQMPPVKSAIKRELREREIYEFEILEIDGKHVLFKVKCEAGTYVRKLVHDFGKELKVGAHMVQLIRTKVGFFTDKNWCSLTELKDAYEFYKEGNEKELRKLIFPIEKAVDYLKKVYVLDGAVKELAHGADLFAAGVCKLDKGINKDELVGVMSLKDRLVCIGVSDLNSEGILKAKKGRVVDCTKVFIEVL